MTEREAAVALLADYGLDAYAIMEDGWTDATYLEAVFDTYGVVIRNDRVQTIERPWPEGFPVERLSQLMRHVRSAGEGMPQRPTVTEEMVDIVQYRLYNDYREGDRPVIRAALDEVFRLHAGEGI